MKQVFIKDSHPISLFLAAEKMLSEKYPEQNWKVWESEVIAKEINDFIKPNKLTKENFNKIMAMKTLYTTDAVWEHWNLFLSIMQSLNSLTLNKESLYITDHPLPYLYNAVEIMNMSRKQEFSNEIKRFCAAIFLHENVHYCASPLEFAQIFVSQPTYTCHNCGKEGSALPPFQFVCESCGGAYNLEEKDKVFNHKPMEVSPETTNVSIRIEHSIGDLQKRYEELKTQLDTSHEDIQLEETETDIQCGKLLLAYEFTQFQLAKLEEELSTYQLIEQPMNQAPVELPFQ